MKSSIRIFLLTFSTIYLTACGSDDEQLPIIGNWEVTNDDITSYYTFSNQQILIRTYIDDFECHSSINIPLGNISSTSFGNNDGDISTYTITGDNLTIEENVILTRPDSTPDFMRGPRQHRYT